MSHLNNSIIGIIYKSQDFRSNNQHDYLHFKWINEFANCRNIDYLNIYKKLGRIGFVKYIDDYIKTNNISILIFLTTYWLEFDVEILKILRKKVYIVYWIFDDVTLYETFTKYYGQLADYVVTEDYCTTFKYKQMGVSSICSFAIWDIGEYKALNIKKDIDVSLIGRMDKDNRIELSEYLSRNCIRIETYGQGSKHGFIDFNYMIRVFNRSKINLNTSGIVTDLLTELEPAVHKMKQKKGRIAEIALTKSFVLSEYVPGLENFFKLGEEIEVFNDKEELLQKIKYYLANENKREEIAKKGYERALQECDKEKAIPKILKDIYEKYERTDWSKRQKEKTIVYFNNSFKKIYSNFRFQYVTYFLKQKKFNFAIQELKIFHIYKKFNHDIFLYYVHPLKEMRSLIAAYFPFLKKIKKIFLRQHSR